MSPTPKTHLKLSESCSVAHSSRPPVFVGAKTFRQNKNNLQDEHFSNFIPSKVCIALGLNVDSEFQTQDTKDIFNPAQKAQKRQVATVQVSDFLNRYPTILAHPDLVSYAKIKGLENQIRHPIIHSECVVVDYLRAQDYHVNMIYDPRALKAKRTLRVTLCGFFQIVDLYTYFQGKCLTFIEEAILKKQLIHQRHLHYVPDFQVKEQRDLRLPYFIDIDGQRFALIIDFLDLCAAQGKTSFKNFCQNVGISLSSKDLIGKNITRMVPYYFEEPALYDAYATGDLMLYPAWKEYCRYIKNLSSAMIGEDFSVEPALTFGSTTNKILDGMRLKYLGFRPDERKSDFYKSILGHNFFQSLDDEENPAHSQLKVDGGRCHNNCPTQTLLTGALCDLDLKGAYTSAMMILPSFFGHPRTVCLYNERLRKVLKKYKNSLRPHHWTMRISTLEPLSFPQDLIPSFFDYKWKERKTDNDSYHETGELDYESGIAKILSREIINGMLTSDILDVILHTWSLQGQKEFFTKIGVISLLYYDPIDEIRDKEQFWQTFYQQKMSGYEPTLWHSVPLKEGGIEYFRNEREKHAKGTPMNSQIKLLGNASYGVTVSHYFPSQNPVVANNVTGYVRVAVYLAEKALGFYQTITDGGLFDLNNILFSKRTGKIYTNKLYQYLTLSPTDLNRELDLKCSGLGGFHWRVEGSSLETLSICKNDEVVPIEDAKKEVNDLCLKHVKAMFPSMPLLQNPYLAFEMKCFFNKATFHGSSNYGFWFENTLDSLKMRGYEKKRHWGYRLNSEDVLVEDSVYEKLSPAQWIMFQIAENPAKVSLSIPFIKDEILKTGTFVERYDKLRASPIRPGDNLKKMGVAKWLSLNQFTYQTEIQMKNWEKAAASLIRRQGLSFELHFFNNNSTINYQEMSETLHHLIESGLGCRSKNEILQHFDKSRHLSRILKKHPLIRQRYEVQKAMKERMSHFYTIDSEEYENLIHNMDDDVLNDCNDIDEENIK